MSSPSSQPGAPLRGTGGFSNQLRTVLLLGALSAVLVGVGGLLGPGMLWLFGALAIALNIGAYFYSDKLVLRMHKAREISPDELPALHRMTAEIAATAGLPMPRLYLLPGEQPNAFATGRNPEHGVVAVTQGLLRLMNERELRGVIAHELSHIRNRDILVASVAACIAAAVSMLAQAGQLALLFGSGRDDEEGGSPLAGLLMIFLAPVAATLIQLGISRSREYLADASAARFTGDPHGLADALEKLRRGTEAHPSAEAPATASLFIMNPLGGGARRLANLFSTHPAVEERVARLRAMA
ncbi:MAG: zinc metalloprotease HtpX [Candidatus Delongbacteria bacterium]